MRNTVVLGRSIGRAFNPWYLLLIIPLLAGGAALWIALRKSGPPPTPYTGPNLPTTLTPVTLLSFLERLKEYEGLPADKREQLTAEINQLQDAFFGPQPESQPSTDLHEIARKWKPAA